jgi:N-methylhydantoinase A/oxoprolinase/acetone carboxylase beta subunit
VVASERDIEFGDLGARLGAVEDVVRGALRRDGIADDAMRVQRWLDCRYAGQGYELRVPVAGDVGPQVFADVHALHRLEYGRDAQGPVEVVNMRVAVAGARRRLERMPSGAGTLDDALLGTRTSVFRVGGELRPLPTRLLDRSRLSPGLGLVGPAIFVQDDSTVVVPPGWQARAHEDGLLVLSAIRDGT